MIYAVVFRDVRFYDSKARKETACWRCQSTIHKGDQAFRPIGNGMNRMQRLCAPCVVRLVAGGAQHLTYNGGDQKP